MDTLPCVQSLHRRPPHPLVFAVGSMAPGSTLNSPVSLEHDAWSLHQPKLFADTHPAPTMENIHFGSMSRTCNNLDYATAAASDCAFQFGMQPTMAAVPYNAGVAPFTLAHWQPQQAIPLTPPYLSQFDHDFALTSHSLDRSLSLSCSTAYSSSVSSLSGMTSQLSDVSELSSRYDSDQESPTHTSLSPSRATSPSHLEARDRNHGLVIDNEVEFQQWCDMEFGPRSRSSTSESVAMSEASSRSIPLPITHTAFSGFTTLPPAQTGSLPGLQINAAIPPSLYTGQGVTPSALTAVPLAPSLSMSSSSHPALCVSPISPSFPNLAALTMASSSPRLQCDDGSMSLMSQASRSRTSHGRANSVVLAAGGRQIQSHSAALTRSLTDQGQTTPRAFSSTPSEYFATPMKRSTKSRSHSQGGELRRNSCLLDSVASERQRSCSVSKSPIRRASVVRSERGTDAQFVCGMMIPGQLEPCLKAYKRTEHLKRHQISHEMVKPYACPLCDRPFDRTDNLNQHIKTHQNKDGRNTKLLKAKLEREREMAAATAAKGVAPIHM